MSALYFIGDDLVEVPDLFVTGRTDPVYAAAMARFDYHSARGDALQRGPIPISTPDGLVWREQGEA